MAQSISIKENNYEKIFEILNSDGVVIVEDIYTENEAEAKKTEIMDSFQKIFHLETNRNGLVFDQSKLISQSKVGLFQALVSNIQTAWDIRQDEKIINIFKYLYTKLYGFEIDDLIVSGDGINLCPPLGKTYKSQGDWAHIDQTDLSKHCIQGQIVLSESDGCFVCTPHSHKIMSYMIDKYNRYSTDLIDGGQWWKFSNSELEEIKTLLEKPELFQIPIIAKKGSMILWFSHTIHSARPPISIGWRTVVYVSYRPDFDYTENEIVLRKEAFEKNYTTNHWGFYHYNQKKLQSENKYLDSLLKNPYKVYDIIYTPKLNNIGKKLLGY